MYLPLELRDLAGVHEVPIATRIAIVAPARNRRVVTQDYFPSQFSLRCIPEVTHPRIHLGLPGRVPRHLAAERIFLGSPRIRTLAHGLFQLGCLRGQSFL